MPLLKINSLEFVRTVYKSWGIIAQQDDLDNDLYEQGLYYLNEILASDQANGINIPSFSQYQFNLTAGQAWYEISQNVGADFTGNPIIDMEDGTLLYSNLIQYPILNVRRPELLGIPLALNTQSWPSQMLLYKFKNISGSKTATIVALADDPNSCVIRFYPIPSMAFPVVLYSKAVLNNIEKNQNILLPPHFLKYLRYSLGKELTNRFENSVWKPSDDQMLVDLKEMFKVGNEIDTSFDPSPTLQAGAPSRPAATNVAYY